MFLFEVASANVNEQVLAATQQGHGLCVAMTSGMYLNRNYLP